MAPSSLAIRRITVDTKKALELTNEGLFWIPDETNICHGWAIICGPSDTVYHGGAYCFEVTFPDDYPFSPPKFIYLTNDGKTRFNPNLYKCGKVCLSLLNTWNGEPWSGVQSLSSILHCIQTAVLNEEPLRNEPGYLNLSGSHPDFETYKRMVMHGVLQTAAINHLVSPPDYMIPVFPAIQAWILRELPKVLAKVRAVAADWDGKVENMNFFSMTVKYKFAELADTLEAAAAAAAAASVSA